VSGELALLIVIRRALAETKSDASGDGVQRVEHLIIPTDAVKQRTGGVL
jgi:hypothetical protein